MNKRTRKERLIQSAEIRRTRDRYMAALKAGQSPDDAAKAAQGNGPIAVQQAKPVQVQSKSVSATPPKPKPTDGPTKVRDTHVAGLADRQPVKKYTLADLPPSWQEMPWAELRKFASDLTGKSSSTRRAAVAAIESVTAVNQPEHSSLPE